MEAGAMFNSTALNVTTWRHTPANTTLSLEEYLYAARGPKHLPLNVVLPITAVYTTIFVTGVVGNVAVCVVIARNNAMHTATNYYLFSLAVSDLALLLLGLPNDLAVFWQQYPWVLGEALCKLRALVSEMMSYTSVLTIVAFSMERYLAICHPLYSYTMSGLRRAVRIIALLWLIALLSAVPFAIFTTVDYITYPPGSDQVVLESAFCAMLDHNVPANWPVYELSFLLFFLIPMICIVVVYVRMGLAIRSRQQNRIGERVEGREGRHYQSRRAIIRMLTTVVVAFFLCWAPFHAQRLLYVYARNSPLFPEVNEWMYYITGCFYYFSSTVNPILYNLMSAKYRDAFKSTLCGRGRARRPSYRDPCTESSVFVRGRSMMQSTIRCKTSTITELCDDTRELNGASKTTDMTVILASNGRSSVCKWRTNGPEDAVNEDARFLQTDAETCI